MRNGLRCLILVPALTGCTELYYPTPRGEVLITVVEDISEYCGGAEACAHMGRPCRVYLTERPTDNTILHEISHCWGRVDRPRRKGTSL